MNVLFRFACVCVVVFLSVRDSPAAPPKAPSEPPTKEQLKKFEDDLKQLDRYLEEGKLELLTEKLNMMDVPDGIRFFKKTHEIGLEIKKRVLEKCKDIRKQPLKNVFLPELYKDFMTKNICTISDKPVELDHGDTYYGIRAPKIQISYRHKSTHYSTLLATDTIDAVIEKNMLFLSAAHCPNGMTSSLIVTTGNLDREDISSSIVICSGDLMNLITANCSIVIARGQVPQSQKGGSLDPQQYIDLGQIPWDKFVLGEKKALDWIEWFQPKSAGMTASSQEARMTIDWLDPKREYAKAGCKVGDKLIKINGEEPRTQVELRRLMMRSIIAGGTELEIERGEGKRESIKLRFAVRE
jgi:hypothetical protein